MTGRPGKASPATRRGLRPLALLACAALLVAGVALSPRAVPCAEADTVTVEMPLVQAGDAGSAAAVSAAAGSQKAALSSGAGKGASSLGKAVSKKLVRRFTQAVESMRAVRSARVIPVSSLGISGSGKTDKKVARLLGDVVNFHPEYFYVSSTITIDKAPSGRYRTIELHYAYKFKTLKKRLRACEKGLKDLLSWVPANGTDLQKVKAVHDWLVRNCTYDANVDYDRDKRSPYNIYGALVTHKPVCQGYSLAFLLAMRQLGIEASCVGQYVGEQGHMWNRVKVGGSWYHVDLTFDDPLWGVTLPSYRDGGFYATPVTKYFMKSDSWWKKHASSGGWHKSWYPRGAAGKDRSYDAKKDWETYRAAAAEPSRPKAAIVDLDEVAGGTDLELGKGATRAVYRVTGAGTVSYRRCRVPGRKASAKVPASVSFRGRSFRVTGISAGAFSGRTAVRTVTVATRKLTAASTKGCLARSRVRAVRVPGTMRGAYAKCFAKGNSGRSVNVNAS